MKNANLVLLEKKNTYLILMKNTNLVLVEKYRCDFNKKYIFGFVRKNTYMILMKNIDLVL